MTQKTKRRLQPERAREQRQRGVRGEGKFFHSAKSFCRNETIRSLALNKTDTHAFTNATLFPHCFFREFILCELFHSSLFFSLSAVLCPPHEADCLVSRCRKCVFVYEFTFMLLHWNIVTNFSIFRFCFCFRFPFCFSFGFFRHFINAIKNLKKLMHTNSHNEYSSHFCAVRISVRNPMRVNRTRHGKEQRNQTGKGETFDWLKMR